MGGGQGWAGDVSGVEWSAHNHSQVKYVTRKKVPITGRASSFLEITLYVRLEFQKQNRN